MKSWTVIIERLVEFSELHPEDQSEFLMLSYTDGISFPITANDEEEALDEFHSCIPIKVLDDFKIEVNENKGED